MGNNRKKLERHHLDIFLRISGLASRVTSIVESERPDFILCIDQVGRVALEHTQPRDGAAAAHAGLLVGLCSAVEEELAAAQLNLWVHLTLGLDQAYALARQLGHHRSWARELVAMVRSDRVAVAGEGAWEEYDEGRLRTRSGHMSLLQQVHVSSCERPICTWGTKRLVQRLALLEDAIVRKEDKLAGYRDHVTAEQFWLLVVSGPGLGALPEQLARSVHVDGDFCEIHVIDEYGQHWFPLAHRRQEGS